jgi:hypothetical protein
MTVVGNLALMFALVYTGLALYITLVEHPARLCLDNQGLLKTWKISYNRGHVIGASMASLTGLLGIASFFILHNWLYLIGAACILINWPYTYIFIMPTNKKLIATTPETANEETRYLVKKWTKLHAIRWMFSGIAGIIFLLALNNY